MVEVKGQFESSKLGEKCGGKVLETGMLCMLTLDCVVELLGSRSGKKR